MIIHDDLKDLFRLLNENNVEYVIVGGYAVAFHGFVRATKDIDILFRNHPDNIQRLTAALIGFGIPEASMDAELFSEQGRIIRMGSSPMLIELSNAVSGATFDEIWRNKILGHYDDIEFSSSPRAIC